MKGNGTAWVVVTVEDHVHLGAYSSRRRAERGIDWLRVAYPDEYLHLRMRIIRLPLDKNLPPKGKHLAGMLLDKGVWPASHGGFPC